MTSNEQPNTLAVLQTISSILGYEIRPEDLDFDARSTVRPHTVTPAAARRWRDEYQFVNQRALRENNIIRLALEMEAGRFVPGADIRFAVNIYDGRAGLIQGNHTCEASDLSKTAFDANVTFHFVTSVEEAGQIYARLDQHAIRTTQDRARAYGSQLPRALDTALWSSARLIASNHKRSTYRDGKVRQNVINSDKMLLPIVEALTPAAQWYAAAFRGQGQGRKIRPMRAGCMSVGLITYAWQPERADNFWRSLAANDGLRAKDARSRLIVKMEDNLKDLPRNEDRNIHLAKACASAWNAYFESRPLQYIRPSQNPGLKILGTPWADGRPRDIADVFPDCPTEADITDALGEFSEGREALRIRIQDDRIDRAAEAANYEVPPLPSLRSGMQVGRDGVIPIKGVKR